MCKNMAQPDKPHMKISCMVFTCRIIRATDTHTHTHSEYVILIGFPRCERASLLRYKYTASLLVFRVINRFLILHTTNEKSTLFSGSVQPAFLITGHVTFFFPVLLNTKTPKLRQWPTWFTRALFYNTLIILLYMFRALLVHHQETKLYRCSIWYPPLSQWPSGAPDGHWEWRYQMLHQYNSTSWWWVYTARNM